MLESQNFDRLFLFHDPIINNIVSMDEFQEASPFSDASAPVRQPFETQRFIEQFMTQRFGCAGIVLTDVGNDIPEILKRCLKDDYSVHADGLTASSRGRIPHHLASFIDRVNPCATVQGPNTGVEFRQEFRAFFLSQLLIEYTPELSPFLFCQLGQLFDDLVETHLYAKLYPYPPSSKSTFLQVLATQTQVSTSRKCTAQASIHSIWDASEASQKNLGEVEHRSAAELSVSNLMMARRKVMTWRFSQGLSVLANIWQKSRLWRESRKPQEPTFRKNLSESTPTGGSGWGRNSQAVKPLQKRFSSHAKAAQ